MESDWPKRNKSDYVKEIVSWLGFADVIFGGDKRQPVIRLPSQATERVIVDTLCMGTKSIGGSLCPHWSRLSRLVVCWQ